MSLNMPVFVDWIITGLVVSLVASYIWHIVALMRQPAARRPRTEVYDRFGLRVGTIENPDYHVIPADDREEQEKGNDKNGSNADKGERASVS